MHRSSMPQFSRLSKNIFPQRDITEIYATMERSFMNATGNGGGIGGMVPPQLRAGFFNDLTDTDDTYSLDFSDSDLADEVQDDNAGIPFPPENNVSTTGCSTSSVGSYSSLYASAHAQANSHELYEEPLDLSTSSQLLDVERQHHLSVIAELESSHKEEMMVHAAEIQLLRKAHETLKDEAQVNATRIEKLLRDKDSVVAQLAEMSGKHQDISSEKNSLSSEVNRLSLRIQEARAKVTDLELNCGELLASRDSLSTQLTEKTHKIEDLNAAATKFAAEMKSVREHGSAEASRLRHELEELAANVKRESNASVALEKQLQSALQELKLERTRARAAALQAADEVHGLMEGRDNLQTDLDRVRRERDELSSASERTIHNLNVTLQSLRADLESKAEELDSVSAQATSAEEGYLEEILSLNQALDVSQDQYEKLVVKVSNLEDVVQHKTDRLDVLMAEKGQLERRWNETKKDRLSACATVDRLQCEKNELEKKITALERASEGARAAATNHAKDLDLELQTARKQNSELVKAKNREVETVKKLETLTSASQKRVDELLDEVSTAKSTVVSKEQDIVSLRSERDSLQRDLEASRKGQQLQKEMMSSDIQDYRSRLTAASANVRKERQAKEELQTKLSLLETEAASLRKQVAEAKDSASQTSSTRLSASLESKDKKISSLRYERESLKEELKSFRADPPAAAAQPHRTLSGQTQSTSQFVSHRSSGQTQTTSQFVFRGTPGASNFHSRWS